MSDQADNGDDDLKPPPRRAASEGAGTQGREPTQVHPVAALTCGVVGLSLAGWMPVAQARSRVCVRRGHWKSTTSSPRASSAGNACRSVRWQRSSWPTSTKGFGIGVPYIDARAQACDFPATPCSASLPVRPAR